MAKKKSNQAGLHTITTEMVETVEQKMQEFTENLIDLPMNDFCRIVELNNVGDLRIKRLYLEDKMFEVDAMCAKAVTGTVLEEKLDREQVLTVAQLFAVLAKIEAKRGYIDFLLDKRKHNPDQV